MSLAPENDESMVRYLVMEVLEAAVNLALSYEPAAQARLQEHVGRVLRIKTTAPDWMFYLAVCEDGIQLFLEYEEVVDARITLPTSLLSQYVLGSYAEDLMAAEGVRVSGDQDFLEDVMQVALEFSIWSLARKVLQSWLPEFEGLTGLIDAFKHNDPAWIVRLEHLPQLANETLMAVRAQGELQQQQIREIESIKRQLAADRRANRISTVIGFCLLVVAFLAHNGYLKVPQLEGISMDTLVLVILSMVILIPRMISGR
ncbi:DUF1418 family protein [Ketobacter sp.]|uniref:DUF1418 family protein n=1 Tax=Ketobacter sp. TaxID=2083498 RepID=UPI0025C3144F|nr:DUF1418 family protein [Ketobacter sp.]MEE2732412.1 DUF1418 family protein [Pseudomonadota bacterium]